MNGGAAVLPFVSVVVTTYNRAGLLRETIDSILNQSFSDFELIVVDNMSADGTEEYVRSLSDPRVRFYSNRNGGIISVNRNYGILKSVGKYVAFCDDDDLWEKAKLEKQVCALRNAPQAGLCYSNALSFCEDTVVDMQMMKKKVYTNHFAGLLKTNFIPTSSVVVKRDVFETIGLFNESRDLLAFEDYELWIRITSRFVALYVDEPLIRYRLHRLGNLGLKERQFRKHVALLQSVRDCCEMGTLRYYKTLMRHYLQYVWRSVVVLRRHSRQIRSA